MASAVSGRPPKRWGNRSSSAAPQGAYPCAGKDEWCVIVVETDEQWRALANAIGRPDLAADERFATVVGRMRHHDELDAAIAAWTRDAAQHRGRADCCSGRRSGRTDAARRRRRRSRRIRAARTGRCPASGKKPLVAPTVPFTFSTEHGRTVRRTPCTLGEHTEEVLRDWLGLDAAEIAALGERHAFGR